MRACACPDHPAGGPAKSVSKVALSRGGQSNAPAVAASHGPAVMSDDKSASARSERASRCSSSASAASNVWNGTPQCRRCRPLPPSYIVEAVLVLGFLPFDQPQTLAHHCTRVPVTAGTHQAWRPGPAIVVTRGPVGRGWEIPQRQIPLHDLGEASGATTRVRLPGHAGTVCPGLVETTRAIDCPEGIPRRALSRTASRSVSTVRSKRIICPERHHSPCLLFTEYDIALLQADSTHLGGDGPMRRA